VTVHCPLDCEFLQEARKHDKAPLAGEVPHPDIPVTEDLLVENEELLVFLANTLFRTAMETPGAADCDAGEALESLIKTYRTLESGIYYETRPGNPLAAKLYDSIQESIATFRKEETERTGISKTRDSSVLKLLAFLHYFGNRTSNGRPLGRAFLDALRGLTAHGPEAAAPPEAGGSSLILP
jgi:hypothetical protein